MGKASRVKWERRLQSAQQSPSAEKKRSRTSDSSDRSSNRTLSTIINGLKYTLSVVVAVVVTLLLTPSLARILSRSRSVTVGYAIEKFSSQCNFYSIGIHSGDNKSTIKQLNLRLKFPGAIKSYSYGTDHSVFREQTAIVDRFDFELPCDVRPPGASDMPSNIQITQPGQAKQELSIIAEDFDPSESFMLEVGVQAVKDPKLDYEGHASYSVWNQDVQAPINVTWLNP
jgi:hypothetical protein